MINIQLCVLNIFMNLQKTKFLGEPQTAYPKKNWSSLMLMNCSRCLNLNIDFVNNASGLDLHRFTWLRDENEIGEIKGTWNTLFKTIKIIRIMMHPIHWTLGGPWFKEKRDYEDLLTSKWFKAREEAIRLYD